MNDINITIPGGASKRLKTAGVYCEQNIIVTAEGGNAQPSVSPKAVTFRDYDGTLLYTYTAEEALALSELPPLPSREGLICQEWNWSLADMKEYVAEYGVCEIGATYITEDGKTRLSITIAAEGRMDVPLYISQTVAHGVMVDWGDGSSVETLPGTGNVNTTHTYASIGDYVITMDVANGCVLGFGNGQSGFCVMGSTAQNAYRSMLRNVFIGKSVAKISDYAFRQCSRLANITIPNSVGGTGNSSFNSCFSLKNIVFPNGTQIIPWAIFNSCRALENISIPNSVGSIDGYAVYDCSFLDRIAMPNRIKSIGQATFFGGSLLKTIKIPKSVESIGINAFGSCIDMVCYDFTNCTSVPTLADANAFSKIPSDCEIRVPAALVAEWKAATNWSAVADNIVGV